MEKTEVAHQKLFKVSRAENQKLLVDIQEASGAESQELEATSGKLQKYMSRSAIESLERVLHLEKPVDTKMIDLEKIADGKLVMMEEKINNR